ncbi:hypothetical protein BV898_02325 [Hypsibius exemplaris]|uniref:Uncharacterized protein n=1 Tax=Hypsibius exemplaris TaxID=2072580 RepID=A0A1W0X8W6_HYPEX|nr:hypothetical protein BV898_02325 [Hypsibius exemplaris]
MQTYFLCSIVLLVTVAHVVQGARNPNRTASAGRSAGRTGGTRDERDLKTFMNRVASGKALSCQSDADCGTRGGNRCVTDKLKLCGRDSVANIFKAADDQTCVADKDCQNLSGAKKLTTRCSRGRCDFCGPKVCLEDSDCCTASATGGVQRCAKLSGYPDKRCWNTCTTKADCNSFGNTRSKLACVENICQKRTRKAKAGAAGAPPAAVAPGATPA